MQKKTITLRLGLEEYAHLREQAEASGLKIEPFLRQLVMGVQLRPRPPDQYAALLRELSAIGNNINQIAHVANGRKDISPAETAEAIYLIRQAWRKVRDAF